MWKLCPFFGETNRDYAVVLGQPQDLNREIECTIYKNSKALSFYSLTSEIEKYCQRWVFDLDGDGTYIFSWTIDNESFYEHHLEIGVVKNIIVVSCDFVEADSKKSLWKKIEKKVADPSYLLHLGDQVYADNAFRMGERLIASGMDQELIKVQVQQEYANRYYKTWNRCNQALSNCSNLFIWDDHEIVNDFCFETASPSEAILGKWSEELYYQFQEQALLHPPETHQWEATVEGLKLLAFQRNTHPICVQEVLTKLQSLKSEKRVLLLFSSGPVPKPQGLTGSLYRLLTGESALGCDKFWAPTDLTALYEGICDWLEEDPERVIAVVGGDLHFAVYGEVVRKNTRFYVLISSPITNQPSLLSKLAARSMDVATVGSCVFTPFIAKARRCFVTINPLTFPDHINLSFSGEKRPKSWRKYWAAKKTFAKK